MDNLLKKVGIVTLDGMHNYGNRLQNYALEQVLKQLGFDAVTLIFTESKSKDTWNRICKKLSKPKEILPMIIKKLTKKGVSEEYASFLKMRELKTAAFSNFQNEYLNNIKIPENSDFSEFYKIIVGSDQVWNPTGSGFKIKNFLVFAPKEKRISYAASFGVTEIPNSLKKYYSRHLMGINEISVREEAGVEIVKKLTGRKAELVLDPTMLLKREFWKKLIPTEEYQDKSYILVYTIRGYNEEKQEKLKEFAKNNAFEIIHIMGDFYDEEHRILAPDEFLHAIRDAKMIFTDSFHCGIFSIMLHKPFVIFERNDGNMGSRLETLLTKFDLIVNLYTPEMKFDDIMFNMDFNNVDIILKEGRNHGIKYLKRALKVE